MVRSNNRGVYWLVSGDSGHEYANCIQGFIKAFIIGMMTGGAVLYGLIQFWGG